MTGMSTGTARARALQQRSMTSQWQTVRWWCGLCALLVVPTRGDAIYHMVQPGRLRALYEGVTDAITLAIPEDPADDEALARVVAELREI